MICSGFSSASTSAPGAPTSPFVMRPLFTNAAPALALSARSSRPEPN
jgi:hypothetical protein